ncbi:hypothetical protein INS49_014233 [Diaporthe citri]|uniref:uncharacterized protein n=1 Tax=Diaporthe citri TaxID=83186 RepID=UPI001C8167B1|nr:uncharacterized protein INS49_014233 [Diaporthe citri]KAG6358349.1 hypothetical protein INS49_014233 [Diaporthe citri]
MDSSDTQIDKDTPVNTQGWINRAYAGDVFDAENPFKPAQEAFHYALEVFKKTLTKYPAKKPVADELFATSTLEDVLNLVLDAKKRYHDAASQSRIQDGLNAFSQRLLYYGNVMDVLVQHHPEYVSLVWGAMKFIFGVTSMLYAHILRFLIRALKYYEESRLMRAVHTITRPAALRYQDLVSLICRDAETVRKHAATSSQAEIRAIHDRVAAFSVQLESETNKAQAERLDINLKLNTLENLVTQVRHTLEVQHAVQASNQIQIRNAVSDVQLRQALSMVASQCSVDHKSLFQSALQVVDTRAAFRQKSKHNVAAFWTSPKLQHWSKAATSSTILLLKDGVAVFWVFMSSDRKYPLLETLRSLVYQALSLDYSQHTEQSMSFQLSKYLDANFEDDYLNMLGDLLQHLKHVYIIVNSEAMAPDTATQCRACLQRLSQLLLGRGCQTILKVIMTSCGSEIRNQDMTGNIVLDSYYEDGRSSESEKGEERSQKAARYP